MSTLGDVAIVAFGMTAAIGLIVGTLLGRAGITSVISRYHVNQRPEIVRANLLLGTGMVLAVGSRMIPAEHRHVWALVLLPVAICLLIASLVQYLVPPRKG